MVFLYGVVYAGCCILYGVYVIWCVRNVLCGVVYVGCNIIWCVFYMGVV